MLSDMTKLRTAFLAMLMLCFPSIAYAYVDPGTGAYLLQLIIAIFGAAVFYVARPRLLWKMFIDFVTRKNKKQ